MVRWQAPAAQPSSNGTDFASVALLLQGGGALGAYQAGVYEALCERGIVPSWVAGISIGAINSAIIAGNAPKDRVAKLRAFWEGVSGGSVQWGQWLPFLAEDPVARGVINRMAAGNTLLSGVPGFFNPRFPPPTLSANGSVEATSWYDTAPLRQTLESLVDFDRINAGETRFSVGAVNIRSGNFTYFDNAAQAIGPEHIMASGALPPGFPPVEIAGEYYWDGGLVSNTPLDWVLSAPSRLDTLVLQVDLWSARGHLPSDLSSVATRAKEIQYSSRTRAATDQLRERRKLQGAFRALFAQLPADLTETPEAKLLIDVCSPARYSIAQLIYHSPTYEGESKDYEFSRQTMADHWRKGYQQAHHTLDQPAVLRLPDDPTGLAVHDYTSPPDEPVMPAKSPAD
ncbi:patatin-like phospholipase family protein [Novosphingobium flavum]|uniref:Patatin-like phospholipase family protein n=2 Tax=Novosphingobium flavum TaxID=1778672 RepID=A0A7X1FSF0_9SPHN|nr:patatin-like phospholipase family protein [Novosphingobium flavum]